MTTYFTNNPLRFSGCYATHNPTASQAPPVVDVVIRGGGTSKKKKTKLIRFSDLDVRERIEALKTIPVKPFISQDVIIIEDDDDEILLMALTRILH